MPVLEVHLVDGQHDPGALHRLLGELSARSAEVLGSPVDRVRVLVTLHRPELVAVGGVVGGDPAPWFTASVLTGRPAGQRAALLAGLTDVLVDVLGVHRARVRGRIAQVPPEDWGIGGVPAAAVRADEVRARAT